MNKVIALTKVLVKSLYDMGGGATNNKRRKRRINSSTGYFALIGVLFLFIALPFAFVAYTLAKGLSDMGNSELIWYLFIPMALVMLMVLSIFTIISVFFLSMDNATLLPLPVKPWQILLARFFTALLLVYTMVITFLVPIFVGFGLGINGGFDYYISALVFVLFIPFIPISIWGIILCLINRVFSFSKHKDAFTYVTMIIAIFLGLGVSFLSQSIMTVTEMSTEDMNIMMQQLANGIGANVVKYLPFLIPALRSFIADSALVRILYALAFAGIGIIFIILFMLIGNKIYLKTLMGSNESVTKKKKLSESEFSKNTKQSNKLWRFAKTEWQLMVRSPVYFLNLIAIVFLFPIIILASFAITSLTMGEEIDITSILGGISVDPTNALTFAILLGVILFLGSVNMISSTAVSRMGSSSGFYKALPVEPKIIIRSKIFWGIILSVFTTLVVLLCLVFLGLINILDLFIFLVVASLIMVATNYIGFYLDLRKPSLNWTNETYAVKNNLNSMIYMFATWGGMIIMMVVGFLLSITGIPYSGYIYAGVIAIGFVILDYYLIKREKEPVRKLFKKM